MTDSNLKIAFFGTPRLAQIVLLHLLDSDFKPSIIVTSPDAKSGRGQNLNFSPVKTTATEKGIEVIQDLKQLPQFDLAILIAFGKILPKEILGIPKYGFLNIHPSLLPKYRGPSPIQTAILNGDGETGVTIIKLDEQVDHGPMYGKKTIEIEKTDTHMALIEKLGLLGSNLLLEVLPSYLANNLKAEEQDHAQATTTKHIAKTDGFIDVQNPPDPQTLDRMIRAYFPWPTVWAEIGTRDREPETSKLRIKLLPNQIVQPEGKKPMGIKEFFNGYPQAKAQMEKLIAQT
ncbi:methionyl-tRNA formyltransferase [Candidatus Curtissbacteria bacterium]|nr:methionyl-tRNA formyltransferase [Candidatus Curtissbacteria bacterium]